MKVSYRVFAPDDFVQVDIAGKVDLDATKREFARLLCEPDLSASQSFLVDFRESDCELSVVDVYLLVKEVSEEWRTKLDRTAIVLDASDVRSLGQFTEDTAWNRGLPLRVFTDYDAAVAWIEGRV